MLTACLTLRGRGLLRGGDESIVFCPLFAAAMLEGTLREWPVARERLPGHHRRGRSPSIAGIGELTDDLAIGMLDDRAKRAERTGRGEDAG